MWGLLRPHDSEEPIMQTFTTVGLDIAKSVFQVHGIDAEGNVLIRRQPLPPGVLPEASRRAWSGSRPVPPRIIGRANLMGLGILCA